MDTTQLVVYQIQDTLNMELPESSVDLLITSLPLDIILEQAKVFFEWCDRCMLPDGIILLDIPGGYNKYTIALWTGEKETPWHFQCGFLMHDVYEEGDTQYLCAYTRSRPHYARSSVPRISDIVYQRCSERTMTHACEFDPVFIGNLINRHSSIGQTVLDPFCGTGIVPCVAYRCKRNAIGIDSRCPFTNEET